MAEELKIGVSAPGAKATEEDLKRVAAAESAVGAAAAGTAPGHAAAASASKKASEAADELKMRDRSLMNELRGLTPETAIAAEAFMALTTRTTAAGMALGLLGAAVGAVGLAITKLSQHQAEQKRRLDELRQSLQQAYEGYIHVAEAIEKTRPAPGRPVSQVIGEAAQIGIELGIEPEVVTRRLAPQMAALGLTGEAARQLGRGMAPPRPAAPEVRRAWATALTALARGAGAVGEPGTILADIAKAETVAGRPRTSIEIENYLWSAMGRTYGGRRGAREELGRFLGTYPEAGALAYPVGVPLEPGGGPFGEAALVGRRGGTFTAQQVFQGTNYIIADKHDPAGRPVPSPARY